MDKIKFFPADILGYLGTYIFINDINLLTHTHIWGRGLYYSFSRHGGLSPDDVFLPSKRFLGKEKGMRSDEGLTCILGCSCGEEGCDPFFARIIEEEDKIIWKDFTPEASKKPLPGLGPFEFDKEEYIKALTRKEYINRKISKKKIDIDWL